MTAAHAFVLTAGLGTRLRPLTYSRAKAAVPIAGEALIRRILRWLADADIRDVILNLHHKPETITRLTGDGTDLEMRVRYSWEARLLGSGGGPRHALDLLRSDGFLIVNGDTLTDLNIDELMSEHERSGADVTMALVPNPDFRRYGGVRVDSRGWVTGFTCTGDPEPSYHFIGVQVVRPAVFRGLPDFEPAHSVSGVYVGLLREKPQAVRAFISSASFLDVGTPADYLETSLAIAAAEGLGSQLPLGRDSAIHPTARLIRTAVWDDVVVEAGCELTECVVGDGVRVPAGSRFEHVALVPSGDWEPIPPEQRLGEVVVAPFALPAASSRLSTPQVRQE